MLKTNLVKYKVCFISDEGCVRAPGATTFRLHDKMTCSHGRSRYKVWLGLDRSLWGFIVSKTTWKFATLRIESHLFPILFCVFSNTTLKSLCKVNRCYCSTCLNFSPLQWLQSATGWIKMSLLCDSKRKPTTSCFQSALECRRNSKVGGKQNSSALTGVLSTKQGQIHPLNETDLLF